MEAFVGNEGCRAVPCGLDLFMSGSSSAMALCTTTLTVGHSRERRDAAGGHVVELLLRATDSRSASIGRGYTFMRRAPPAMADAIAVSGFLLAKSRDGPSLLTRGRLRTTGTVDVLDQPHPRRHCVDHLGGRPGRRAHDGWTGSAASATVAVGRVSYELMEAARPQVAGRP